MAAWQSELRSMLGSGQPFSALNRAAPSAGGFVRCYMRRKPALLGSGDLYHLYLEESDLYLMSALHYSSKGGSRFLMATDPSDLDKSRSTCIGKVCGGCVWCVWCVCVGGGGAGSCCIGRGWCVGLMWLVCPQWSAHAMMVGGRWRVEAAAVERTKASWCCALDRSPLMTSESLKHACP
jgi:hypothetical protein